MNTYVIINNGLVVNRTLSKEPLANNWVQSEIAQIGWLYDSEKGNFYPPPEPKEVIPNSVTKRQGRQQMIILGLLDQVQAAIDSIPDPIQKALVQSFWDDSTQYERNHPQMIQLSAAVGMTEEQLDQAFIAASQL